MHLANDPVIVPVHQLAYTVAGGALVAHLRYYLVALCRFGEYTCLIHIVCQRLLYIYVFTQLHSCQGLYRMIMVGGGDRYGVKVFGFFIHHLTPVPVILCFGKTFDRVSGSPVIHIAEESYICFT